MERNEAPIFGLWTTADYALVVAEQLVTFLQTENDDSPYGLLQSAINHIRAARADLDADLK